MTIPALLLNCTYLHCSFESLSILIVDSALVVSFGYSSILAAEYHTVVEKEDSSEHHYMTSWQRNTKVVCSDALIGHDHYMISLNGC
mmetsp:Transcript_14472/g.35017  ORF Transcript_14472/g.35017 Transcript_14472/m.35017 type:complete len:87 (-) Transcript_14472:25-285(-)